MSTITNPTTSPTPITSPTPGPGAAVGTSSIGWNDAARATVGAGLGMVPEVGGLLSAMLKIFWPPTKEDVWGEVRAQSQQMVNQAISDAVYEQTTNALNGLQSATALYLQYVGAKTPDFGQIRMQWTATNTLFVDQCPAFQSPSYTVPLLPLFAQFVNMHLSLMRDGVLFGRQWGWTDSDYDIGLQNLQTAITTYTAYAQGVIGKQDQALRSGPVSAAQVQPWRNVNAFDRAMKLTVNDYVAMWPYYDPTVHPAPVPANAVVFNREVYSDPYGSTADSLDPQHWPGLWSPAPSPPTQQLRQITIASEWNPLWAQVTYPSGGGPNGWTTTPKMGISYFFDQTPAGNITVFNISPSNPINHVEAFADTVVHGIQWYTDTQGGGSGVIGDTHGTNYNFSAPGHFLSSLWFHGTGSNGRYIDCVVFGLQLGNQNAFAVPLSALGQFYVTSPSGTTLEALAARCAPAPGAAAGATPVSVADLQAKVAAEGWDAQRSAFRSYLAAVAKPQ